MAFSLRELWQKISFSDAVSGSADAAQAVFDLAEAINEQQGNSERIKELAAKIPTLLEHRFSKCFLHITMRNI